MDSVMELESSCFPKAPYPREFFERVAHRSDFHFLVYEKDGLVVGDMVFDRNAHALTLAVSAECRRKGIATSLVRKALEMVESPLLFLEVRKSNRSAKSFYKTLGGRYVRGIEDYYTDPPEDGELWIIPKKDDLKG